MVKLLRLTTDDNGNFNADLDAGIQLSENAQIAVQNLTFETTFDILNVNANNRDVNFSWNLDGGGKTYLGVGQLQVKEYTSDNISELSIDLQGALNDTQELDTSNLAATADDQNYGEFKCSEDINTTLSNIQYKLCPLTGPFHINEGAAPREPEDNNVLFDITSERKTNTQDQSLQIGNDQSDSGINIGSIQQKAAHSQATNLLRNYIFPVHENGELSRGSGILMCDVRQVIDNGGAADTNGFGIGLSNTPLSGFGLASVVIPETARTFEIRIKRPQDAYSFHNNNVEATSTQMPHKVNLDDDTNVRRHDLMMIEKFGNKIIGSVANTFGYTNLAAGGNWVQSGGGAIENFDTTGDLGIAHFRRTQVGSALEQWWEATSSTGWNLYNTGPPTAGQTPDNTATIDLITYVITIGAATFTPQVGTTPLADVGGVDGTKHILFEHILPAAQRNLELYPYIYCCGGLGEATVGHPQFTPHCLTDENLAYQRTGRIQELQVSPTPASGFANGFELYLQDGAGSYADVLGASLNDDAFENDLYNRSQNLVIEINNKVLRILGFNTGMRDDEDFLFSNTSVPRTGIRLTNDNVCGFDLISQNENTVTNSDNYILMLDSSPLKSYDASKFNYDRGALQNAKQSHRGRKINILATIPVNDSSNGIVQFQANELVYIDLDNKFPTALKNIRLRLLDKNFQEINTFGTSILTLLIKDE